MGARLSTEVSAGALLIATISVLALYLLFDISTNQSILSGEEWNYLLLGGITVIGMGAILACVRCRRKKRGFEVHYSHASM